MMKFMKVILIIISVIIALFIIGLTALFVYDNVIFNFVPMEKVYEKYESNAITTFNENRELFEKVKDEILDSSLDSNTRRAFLDKTKSAISFRSIEKGQSGIYPDFYVRFEAYYSNSRTMLYIAYLDETKLDSDIMKAHYVKLDDGWYLLIWEMM